jgi:excisionase family DNA binding protein
MTENGKAPLMTYADVAARLGLKKRTVESYKKRGLLPYLEIGRHIRFEPEAVEEFIKIRRDAARGPQGGV